MKLLSLGSGSSGNCYYIESQQHALLVDLGIGIRLFKKYASNYALPLHRLQALLLTHDHMDHVKAAGVFAQHRQLPVYATDAVFHGMEINPVLRVKVPANLQRRFNHGETQTIGPFQIKSFLVPHDASSNSGYYITDGITSLCLMTDIGHITEELRLHVSTAEHIIVEANYDTQMLETGRYPQFLKQRIRSGYGHLSNSQTAEFLYQCLTPATRNVFLCHLSEENNMPEKAHNAISEAIKARGLSVNLVCLRRKIPTGFFEL